MIALPLNPHVHDLLIRLSQRHSFGFEWVGVAEFQDIPMVEREFALNEGFVKERGFGNVRQYRLTQVGKDALAAITDQMLEQMQSDPDDVEDVNAPDPIEPEIPVSLYGETLGTEIEEPPAEPARTRRAVSFETCIEDGCNERRYSTPARKYNRCKAHQQAVWRERENKVRTAGKTQPSLKIVEPSFADEDTRPDINPIVDTPPRDHMAGDQPAVVADSTAGPYRHSLHRPGAAGERIALI